MNQTIETGEVKIKNPMKTLNANPEIKIKGVGLHQSMYTDLLDLEK